MNCRQCGKPINERQKYCSPYCRTAYWQANNREKAREYNRKWRAKQVVLCRGCKKPVPSRLRKSGVTYCSDRCRRITFLARMRVTYKEIARKFDEFKRSIGCQICGYNRCGACLDFHHREPKQKKFRITGRHWTSNSIAVRCEIAKCNLLCKNCHYEQHHLEPSCITA